MYKECSLVFNNPLEYGDAQAVVAAARVDKKEAEKDRNKFWLTLLSSSPFSSSHPDPFTHTYKHPPKHICLYILYTYINIHM